MVDFVKVCLNKKERSISTVAISLIASVSIVGFSLMTVSLAKADFLFAIWYFIAFLLALVYVVIRINAVFPTYVLTDGEKLVMSIWDNEIMPYKWKEKPTFFSDFIPDSVKTDEILIKDIKSVYVGSERLFYKELQEEEIPQKLKQALDDSHISKAVKRMNFMLVVAKDGEECFMSIDRFDNKALKKLLDIIEKNGDRVQILTNMPKLIKERKE